MLALLDQCIQLKYWILLFVKNKHWSFIQCLKLTVLLKRRSYLETVPCSVVDTFFLLLFLILAKTDFMLFYNETLCTLLLIVLQIVKLFSLKTKQAFMFSCSKIGIAGEYHKIRLHGTLLFFCLVFLSANSVQFDIVLNVYVSGIDWLVCLCFFLKAFEANLYKYFHVYILV